MKTLEAYEFDKFSFIFFPTFKYVIELRIWRKDINDVTIHTDKIRILTTREALGLAMIFYGENTIKKLIKQNAFFQLNEIFNTYEKMHKSVKIYAELDKNEKISNLWDKLKYVDFELVDEFIRHFDEEKTKDVDKISRKAFYNFFDSLEHICTYYEDRHIKIIKVIVKGKR